MTRPGILNRQHATPLCLLRSGQLWQCRHVLGFSAADNRNRWTFPSKAPRCCTSSRVSIPSRIGGSSFALKPSQIKTAPNHTAGKSVSTDALDWITVALSIGRNIFLTSLTKSTITNNLLDILCQDVATVSNIEANRHISLTDAIIHVHKLAAGKFLWNNHHALVRLHRTISSAVIFGKQPG